MTTAPRILRVTAALVMTGAVLTSCGGAGTGETASKAPAAVVTAPAATVAPAAAPAAPAAAKALILVGDVVRGPNRLTPDEKVYLSCVQANRIPQDGQIVWRFKVIDPATAKPMDDKALKSFVLTLPDGSTKALKYGGHGGPNKTDDFFWTTSFDVPKDYPTGAFPYKILATSTDGITGSYDQFKIASAMLQVVAFGKP